MKRCCCGGPVETPDSNGIDRARACAPAAACAKTNDMTIIESRDREREAARRSGTAASCRARPRIPPQLAPAANLTKDPRARTKATEKPLQRSVTRGVTKSAAFRRSDDLCAAATMGPWQPSKSPPAGLADRARGREDPASFMAEEPDGEAAVLRVAVQGGGCSGFEYALGFDRGAQEGDHELELHGVTRRRRPVQRAVPPGCDASTSSTASRSPASRSRTRTSPSVLRLRPLVPGGRRGRAAERRRRLRLRLLLTSALLTRSRHDRLRVAVVGSGPAGLLRGRARCSIAGPTSRST